MLEEDASKIVERAVDKEHRDKLACYEKSNKPCNLSSFWFPHR